MIVELLVSMKEALNIDLHEPEVSDSTIETYFHVSGQFKHAVIESNTYRSNTYVRLSSLLVFLCKPENTSRRNVSIAELVCKAVWGLHFDCTILLSSP